MKISLSWLKRYVALEASIEAVETALMQMGFEVEGIEQKGLAPSDYLIVGEVLERQPHPNADRLSVCQVQTAPEAAPRTIVCGASNYKVGDRVPVALPGALLPGDFKIKKSKLRGVMSEGMMCSARELGLGEDHKGLMILNQDSKVGLPIHELFSNSDVVFDIEVTPNRPDCLSHIGIARELAAHFGQTSTWPKSKEHLPVTGAATDTLLKNVVVDDADACPFYSAYSIRGVKVGPSPEWLRQSLESVGLRSINNIVDITNFILLESGQPLHAFDAAKVRGSKLHIRYACKGETLTTLDDKKRELNTEMLVIADTERPLAIAGIMGGVEAEVSTNTHDIILEAANFNPFGIRQTSRALALSTDSAYRFERGVDACGINRAAQRAIDLILQTAGGTLSSPSFSIGEASEVPCTIEVTPDFIRRHCGFGPDNARIRSILESLELVVSDASTDDSQERWQVRIPSFRSDLKRPIDLVEEFLRVYGTDHIPSVAVQARGLHRHDDPFFVYTTQAADFLTARGFYQCVNYSLRSEQEVEQGFGRSKAAPLRLSHPLASDQSHLRTSLIPGLLDVLKHNQAHKTAGQRFFEIGRVFREREGQVYELLSTALVLFHPTRDSAWLSREPEDFYTLKQISLDLLGIRKGRDSKEPLDFKPLCHAAFWQEGHAAFSGDFRKGCEIELGVLSFSESKRRGIVGSIGAVEMVLLPERQGSSLQPSSNEIRPQFQPFSSFPPVGKDLALLVESAIPAEEVRRTVEVMASDATGEKFSVEDVSIFDVYCGEEIPEGHKSLALSLKFQALDRTLKDEEVNRVFESIQKRIEAQTSYQVRR